MNDEMVKNKKGFTLAELLIVVAIIAVLVAISIPIFTSQLKKARLAVDHSAMRDAYALAQVANNLQEIEIEGTAYSFDDLKLKEINNNNTKVYFVLAEDCNHLIFKPNDAPPFVAPAGAYAFKENGCDDSNAYKCETCGLWGAEGFHFKGNGINLYYDSVQNLIIFGL